VTILAEYILLQGVTILCWALIYRKLLKLNKRPGTVLSIVHFLAYLSLSVILISDLTAQPDWCIGGVTFAFEMLSLIFAGVFSGLLLFIWLIFRLGR
jgi:hypothetical protein